MDGLDAKKVDGSKKRRSDLDVKVSYFVILTLQKGKIYQGGHGFPENDKGLEKSPKVSWVENRGARTGARMISLDEPSGCLSLHVVVRNFYT